MGADVEKTVEPFVGPLANQERPIDVKVTGSVRTEATESGFATGSATMSNGVESVPVLPSDRHRTAATILNPPAPEGSGLTVWILSSRGGSIGGGFPLVSGAALDVGHQAEVFALCPGASAATQATVFYVVERSK